MGSSGITSWLTINRSNRIKNNAGIAHSPAKCVGGCGWFEEVKSTLVEDGESRAHRAADNSHAWYSLRRCRPHEGLYAVFEPAIASYLVVFFVTIRGFGLGGGYCGIGLEAKLIHARV